VLERCETVTRRRTVDFLASMWPVLSVALRTLPDVLLSSWPSFLAGTWRLPGGHRVVTYEEVRHAQRCTARPHWQCWTLRA